MQKINNVEVPQFYNTATFDVLDNIFHFYDLYKKSNSISEKQYYMNVGYIKFCIYFNNDCDLDIIDMDYATIIDYFEKLKSPYFNYIRNSAISHYEDKQAVDNSKDCILDDVLNSLDSIQKQLKFLFKVIGEMKK